MRPPPRSIFAGYLAGILSYVLVWNFVNEKSLLHPRYNLSSTHRFLVTGATQSLCADCACVADYVRFLKNGLGNPPRRGSMSQHTIYLPRPQGDLVIPILASPVPLKGFYEPLPRWSEAASRLCGASSPEARHFEALRGHLGRNPHD